MAYNFADLFEHAVDAMPERTAVIHGSRRITYAQLENRANQLADHLASIGVGFGVHVGIQMHNSIETVEALLACYKLRAVPININYRYQAAELRYLYDNADLEVLFFHRSYVQAIAAAAAKIPRLQHAIVVEDDLGSEHLYTKARQYEQVLKHRTTARPRQQRSGDDPFIMYTGGTTGLPKGVMWRQEDMWRVLGGGIDFYTGEFVQDEYQQSRVGAANQRMIWLMLPPMIHAAAMMPTFLALWTGNTVIFQSRFEPVLVWGTVERERPHVMVITGDAMARPLLDTYRTIPVDASSLIAIASGAALLSQSTKNELLSLFPTVLISDSIGSAETGFGGMGFAAKDDDLGRGPRVRIGRGVVVVDENGSPAAAGEEGWLAKTGAVPIGYYKDVAKTEQLFRLVDTARVVITEDRARVEADGSITLLGRGNMVINTGGEKVFAEEVEGVLKAYPGVYDAVVVAVPHERWGQVVATIVAVASGASVDLWDLTVNVRGHLASYKVPRMIWRAPSIMRQPSGKPDYRWANGYIESRTPDHVTDRLRG